jgi:hypothetical protein
MKKYICVISVITIVLFYLNTHYKNKVNVYNYDGKYNIIELSDNFFKIEYNGKFGVMSNKGKILISPLFENIIIDNESNNIIAEKNNKVGVISSDNEILVPFDYDGLVRLNKNYYKGIKNEEIILINIKNKNTKSYGKDNEIKFYNDKFFIIENGKIEVYDKDFNFLTTYKGNDIFKLNDKVLLLKQEEQLFLICNKLILYHKDIEQIYEDYMVINNGMTKQLKKIGERDVLLNDYSSIYINNLKNIIVEKNGKFGVIDLENKIVIPLNYTKITPLYEGYYGIEKMYSVVRESSQGEVELVDEYKCGLLSESGEEIIDPNYEAIMNFNRNFAIVLDKNGTGVISLINKRKIIETKDGEIDVLGTDKFFIKEKGVIRIYSNKGKVLIKLEENLVKLISSKYIITDSKIFNL